MKRTKLRTKWEPGGKVAAAVPLRIRQSKELEQLKQSLLQQRLAQAIQQPDLDPAYRRAAQDAASLAWLTPYPLLFLPLLFEEKAEEARRHTFRQRKVLKRTSPGKVLV